MEEQPTEQPVSAADSVSPEQAAATYNTIGGSGKEDENNRERRKKLKSFKKLTGAGKTGPAH